MEKMMADTTWKPICSYGDTAEQVRAVLLAAYEEPIADLRRRLLSDPEFPNAMVPLALRRVREMFARELDQMVPTIMQNMALTAANGVVH